MNQVNMRSKLIKLLNGFRIQEIKEMLGDDNNSSIVEENDLNDVFQIKFLQNYQFLNSECGNSAAVDVVKEVVNYVNGLKKKMSLSVDYPLWAAVSAQNSELIKILLAGNTKFDLPNFLDCFARDFRSNVEITREVIDLIVTVRQDFAELLGSEDSKLSAIVTASKYGNNSMLISLLDLQGANKSNSIVHSALEQCLGYLNAQGSLIGPYFKLYFNVYTKRNGNTLYEMPVAPNDGLHDWNGRAAALTLAKLIEPVEDVERNCRLVMMAINYTEVITQLFEKGFPADFELPQETTHRREPSSPLLLASAQGIVDSVKMLLSRGADINQADSQGMMPLTFAIKFDRGDVVDLLLEKKADCNVPHRNGRTALLWASIYGHEALALKVLASRCVKNIDQQDRFGDTALIIAATDGLSGLLRCLLEMSADLKLQNYMNESALIALAKSNNKAADFLLLLGYIGKLNPEDRRAVFNATTWDGRTALLHAAARGNLDMVGALLAEPDVDRDVTDLSGASVWTVAMAGKHTEILRLLSEAGVIQQRPEIPWCFEMPYAAGRDEKSSASIQATYDFVLRLIPAAEQFAMQMWQTRHYASNCKLASFRAKGTDPLFDFVFKGMTINPYLRPGFATFERFALGVQDVGFLTGGIFAWKGKSGIDKTCRDGFDSATWGGSVRGAGEYFANPNQLALDYRDPDFMHCLLLSYIITDGDHCEQQNDITYSDDIVPTLTYVVKNPVDNSLSYVLPLAVVYFSHPEIEEPSAFTFKDVEQVSVRESYY